MDLNIDVDVAYLASQSPPINIFPTPGTSDLPIPRQGILLEASYVKYYEFRDDLTYNEKMARSLKKMDPTKLTDDEQTTGYRVCRDKNRFFEVRCNDDGVILAHVLESTIDTVIDMEKHLEKVLHEAGETEMPDWDAIFNDEDDEDDVDVDDETEDETESESTPDNEKPSNSNGANKESENINGGPDNEKPSTSKGAIDESKNIDHTADNEGSSTSKGADKESKNINSTPEHIFKVPAIPKGLKKKWCNTFETEVATRSHEEAIEVVKTMDVKSNTPQSIIQLEGKPVCKANASLSMMSYLEDNHNNHNKDGKKTTEIIPCPDVRSQTNENKVISGGVKRKQTDTISDDEKLNAKRMKPNGKDERMDELVLILLPQHDFSFVDHTVKPDEVFVDHTVRTDRHPLEELSRSDIYGPTIESCNLYEGYEGSSEGAYDSDSTRYASETEGTQPTFSPVQDGEEGEKGEAYCQVKPLDLSLRPTYDDYYKGDRNETYEETMAKMAGRFKILEQLGFLDEIYDDEE